MRGSRGKTGRDTPIILLNFRSQVIHRSPVNLFGWGAKPSLVLIDTFPILTRNSDDF